MYCSTFFMSFNTYFEKKALFLHIIIKYMTNKHRKIADICQDFDNLILLGYKIENICKIVGFKYYITEDTAYNIYQKNKDRFKEKPAIMIA